MERRRYYTRIYLWSLLGSAVFGAAFGHFYVRDPGFGGFLHGALAGILISAAIILIEVFVFNGLRLALFSRLPFLLYLALRSLGYLAAIFVGLALSTWIMQDAAPGDPLIQHSGVVFSLVMSFGFNLLYGVNRLLGQGVLFSFVAGRYRRPRIEERVLLMIDMESSTAIAERLGEVGFLDFLNRFVADVTASILAQRGEIYKYVGDEIIVTWALADGLRDGRCIRACFDALLRLDMLAGGYERDFGRRASFRAALHCGPVVIGELGVIKMEIALLGDTMNTAARLLEACRDTGHRVLASAVLVDRLAALPHGIVEKLIAGLQLRGKESPMDLYALASAAQSPPRTGANVTVLAARSA